MTSFTLPKTWTIKAGLMWGNVDGKVEFDLHSGDDGLSMRGTARVTMGEDGRPAKIVWERDL